MKVEDEADTDEKKGEGMTDFLHRIQKEVTYKTGDLVQKNILEIGDGYRAKNSEMGLVGLPFARAGNINNGFQFDEVDLLAEENLDNVGPKVSQPGDIVFTSKGTVGRFACVRDDTPQFVYSPQLCYWRVKDAKVIYPRFLYYWMQSSEFYMQVNSVKGQTDMAEYVSLSDQRRMTLTLPPLAEQQAIAATLGALDDKIELNRCMNQTLEELGRTLFRAWFVDFALVRAKREGQTPDGIDAETAALFPAEFEDSAMGPIPKGWTSEPLSHAMQVNPPRKLVKGEVAPYLDMANMPTRSARALEVYDRPYNSGTKFENGDTLVARITPCLENGKTAFVDFLAAGQVGWGSTEYIVLRPKLPLPEEFAYFLARTEAFRDYAVMNMTGSSGRQRVVTSSLDHFYVAVPDTKIVNQFGQIAKQLMKSMKANDKQSRTLATLRDALLPKLLSGAMRVAEAEKQVEELK